LTNPVTATGTSDAHFISRSIVPHVSHEGLAFDKDNSLYFIDELNGGSIYKYVSANPNATNGDDYFAAGQTFSMLVNGGNNANAVGAITWAPITNATGGALAGVSALNADGSIDGRLTANAVHGTDYQRPEDMEIKTLANGDQMIFVTTTTTNEIYSLNLASNQVKLFASRDTIDEASGAAVGTTLTSPDNLAIDAAGNIYIIEDQPGSNADIWFARDTGNDGVAESLGRWASMSTIGAEPTGLYFDKFNPNIAYVNVQHPDSLADSTIMISAVPAGARNLRHAAGGSGSAGSGSTPQEDVSEIIPVTGKSSATAAWLPSHSLSRGVRPAALYLLVVLIFFLFFLIRYFPLLLQVLVLLFLFFLWRFPCNIWLNHSHPRIQVSHVFKCPQEL
jgi:secreted PhoX family phosphatase